MLMKNLIHRTTLFIWLTALAGGLSTCKKATKYPFNLCGEWIDLNGPTCYLTYITILRSDHSTYGTYSDDKGCEYRHWTGKARFNEKHLYIGLNKFTFVQKPAASGNNDSIYVKGIKYKVLATMVLHNSALQHHDTHHYQKYIEY